MNVEQLTIETLLNHAGVAAIVGNNVFPLVASQDIETPYIVVSKVSDIEDYTHCGFSKLKKVRIQIACYAKTEVVSGYKTVKELADQARSAMLLMGSNAKAVFKNSDIEAFDPNTRFFQNILDFIIEWEV